MRIEKSVAFVTGANRGLGREFTRALLEGGAAKVYGGARDPHTITEPGVVPVALDITDPGAVAAAAALAGDVTLLINNAGTSSGGSLLTASDSDRIRSDFNTNVFGTADVARAFAPILGANGGGAMLNVLSALSFVTLPAAAGYSASKAAAWSLTNALRLALLSQGTQVVALHVGFMDTDMVAHLAVPKIDPRIVAQAALNGIEDGRHEVLADDTSRVFKNALSGDLSVAYPALVTA
jgi:NAD(P)-dependent dehydrogenase (short-subunit alcohol dehydrogenase family)